MSMKKNVAIVDGKASHVPSTPSTLSSPPVEEQVEVKLDDKMLTTFLSDAKVFDLWKGLADAGSMLVPYGIKDAAHLENVINKQGREVILSAKTASAKAELEATIIDVLDRCFDDTTRKDVLGQIDFRYDHKNSVWSFRARVNHNDLAKKKRNGNGKQKNGNDLPNAKPASKKKRNGKGNGRKKKFEEVIFKGPMKKITSSGKKKYDALNRRLPGHYGANQ